MTIFAIQHSVLAVVIARVIAGIINTFITMIYSGREINYFFNEQIKDILGIMLCATVMALCIYLFGINMDFNNHIIMLISQLCLGSLIFFTLVFSFKLSVLDDLKDIINIIRNNR